MPISPPIRANACWPTGTIPASAPGSTAIRPRCAACGARSYAAGADVILNGHDHDYERFALQDWNGQADPQGIRQIVVGTGGRSLDPF